MSDLDVALRAAQAAAEIVRGRYGDQLRRYDKGAADFATEVDIAAEAAIRAVLHAERPGDAIVGEELGGTGDAARTWLVDPLCGTLNYAAHTPLAAVNIALRSDDAVPVAVTADPIADELFWTAGEGAFVRRGGRDQRLTPAPDSRIIDVNLDPPFPNGATFRAVRMLADDAFGTRWRPRVLSTTLALAWVAAGRRAGYVTDGLLSGSVHFASGIALCQAAGCVVTNLVGAPVHTGIEGLVVGADPATHRELLALVARHHADRFTIET